MPNYKQAPKLYHNKTSFNDKNYYNLPQGLMDRVFNELDGKCGNQIKLIITLLGTLGDGTFGVSEAWICERTGMVQQTYSTARKALMERGWVYLEDGNLYVLPEIIRYGFPYPEGATNEEKQAIKIATISNCVNRLKSQFHIGGKTQCDIVSKAQSEIVPKTQCDIVYNIINTNNSNINNNSVGTSSPSGADGPTPRDKLKIEGEISQATANGIIDKQLVADDLILTSTGKYFRIRR